MGWGSYLTHRQFVLWKTWSDEEMNTPSRDNYYQMQIAAEIQKTRVKNPNKIKVDSFKLKFSEKTEQKIDLTNPDMENPEFRKTVEETKRRVIGFMTAPITVRVNGEEKETITPPQVQRQELLKKIEERRRARAQKVEQQKQNRANRPTIKPQGEDNGRKPVSRTRRTRRQISEDAGRRDEEDGGNGQDNL